MAVMQGLGMTGETNTKEVTKIISTWTLRAQNVVAMNGMEETNKSGLQKKKTQDLSIHLYVKKQRRNRENFKPK